jgi:hypothetical protein
VTGEVLTAANVNDFLMKQSVMVFADGAARDSALGTAIAGGNALVEGMLTYNKDTEAVEVYDGTSWTGVGGVSKEKRVERFTGSGTWTVPAGVTYAIAHVCGGGGGVGRGAPTAGGNSTVDLTGGTITGVGGRPGLMQDNGSLGKQTNGAPNSGNGGNMSGYDGAITAIGGYNSGADAIPTLGGNSVTPGASITVTVGAGGGSGTSGATGGSGWVAIEYFEEV